MERFEFVKIMAFLEAGCGKQLSEDSVEVYYDLLGNLPVDALQNAAREALLHNTFPVFPQIGTLQEYAQTYLRRGRLKAIRERESWWENESPSLGFHGERFEILASKLKSIGKMPEK